MGRNNAQANLGVHGPVPLALGILFVSLLWLESVMSLCAGYKIYTFLTKLDIAHPADAPARGGGAREISPSYLIEKPNTGG